MYTTQDYFSIKEARRVLNALGIPYARIELINFFFAEEQFFGKSIFFPKYSLDEMKKIIEKSKILNYVEKFSSKKNKVEKEEIRKEAYALLAETIKNFKTP